MKYIQTQTTGIINLIMDDFLDILIPLPESLSTQEEISRNYFKELQETLDLKKLIEEKLEKNFDRVCSLILGES